MKQSTWPKGFIGLTTAASIAALPARAQVKKGTLMLGTNIGNTAYSSATSDYGYDNGSTRSTGTKTYTFSVGPQLGVFLCPHVVLGGTLAVNVNHSDVNTSNIKADNTSFGSKTVTTTTTFSLGPFLRYYFGDLTTRNWFYGQVNGAAGTGMGTSSGNGYATTTTNTTDGKVNSIFNWNAGGSLGMTHFFDKRIGMDVSLGYNYSHAHSDNVNTTSKSTDIVTTTTNNYTLSTGTNGVTLGVGFHWFL